MNRVKFKAGESIFAEGDESALAYVIENGNVEIFRIVRGEKARLAVLGKGDIFGEMGLVDERPRSASAAATNDVLVRTIDRDRFLDMLYNDPAATLPIIKVLFERLRQMNNRYLETLEHLPETAAIPTDFSARILPLTPTVSDVISVSGAVVDHFPFRVGREPVSSESSPLDWNDLAFPDRVPFNMSLNHFALERTERGMVVRDRGSRFGTIVNGARIGGLARDNTAPLDVGSNEVIAGRSDSPFRFKIDVERV